MKAIPLVLDLAGTFVFALSGAMLPNRYLVRASPTSTRL